MASRAPCLTQLVFEITDVFPNRQMGKGSSDGWLGDQAHQARKSDHNPDPGTGIVRAQDIDEDLHGEGKPSGQADMAKIAEHIRQMGEAGDSRLNGGSQNGYIIYEGRIAGAGKGWQWREYTGPNKHSIHIHVSVAKNSTGYNSRASWGIKELFGIKIVTPTPQPLPQEEEMFIVNQINDADQPDKYNYWFVVGNKYTDVAGPEELKLLKTNGIKEYNLDVASFNLVQHLCTHVGRS